MTSSLKVHIRLTSKKIMHTSREGLKLFRELRNFKFFSFAIFSFVFVNMGPNGSKKVSKDICSVSLHQIRYLKGMYTPGEDLCQNC